MPATANSTSPQRQADFSQRVKIRLIELQLTVTDLAKKLGLHRNTVSLAIHKPIYEPTRKRIAAYLSIRL